MAVPPSRRLAILALLGAAALGIGACDRPGSSPAGSAPFKAVDITGADYARELQLPDAMGTPRSLAEFKGKLVVVFFGFTQCPDVCPGTLVELAAVKTALGADGDRLQGVLVTLDPERDTPAVLQPYVDQFGAGFVALRGSPEATRAAAQHFKIFYSKVPGKTEGNYSIDHTAGAYVFDTRGKVRLFTRYGAGAEALAHDLKLLLKEG